MMEMEQNNLDDEGIEDAIPLGNHPLRIRLGIALLLAATFTFSVAFSITIISTLNSSVSMLAFICSVLSTLLSFLALLGVKKHPSVVREEIFMKTVFPMMIQRELWFGIVAFILSIICGSITLRTTPVAIISSPVAAAILNWSSLLFSLQGTVAFSIAFLKKTKELRREIHTIQIDLASIEVAITAPEAIGQPVVAQKQENIDIALERFVQLHRDGVLSDEEFEEAKKLLFKEKKEDVQQDTEVDPVDVQLNYALQISSLQTQIDELQKAKETSNNESQIQKYKQRVAELERERSRRSLSAVSTRLSASKIELIRESIRKQLEHEIRNNVAQERERLLSYGSDESELSGHDDEWITTVTPAMGEKDRSKDKDKSSKRKKDKDKSSKHKSSKGKSKPKDKHKSSKHKSSKDKENAKKKDLKQQQSGSSLLLGRSGRLSSSDFFMFNDGDPIDLLLADDGDLDDALRFSDLANDPVLNAAGNRGSSYGSNMGGGSQSWVNYHVAFISEWNAIYYRNERKNLQCFPRCFEFGEYSIGKLQGKDHRQNKRNNCVGVVQAQLLDARLDLLNPAKDLIIIGRIAEYQKPDIFESATSKLKTMDQFVMMDMIEKGKFLKAMIEPSSEMMGAINFSFQPNGGTWMFGGELDRRRNKSSKPTQQFTFEILIFCDVEKFKRTTRSASMNSFNSKSSTNGKFMLLSKTYSPPFLITTTRKLKRITGKGADTRKKVKLPGVQAAPPQESDDEATIRNEYIDPSPTKDAKDGGAVTVSWLWRIQRQT